MLNVKVKLLLKREEQVLLGGNPEFKTKQKIQDYILNQLERKPEIEPYIEKIFTEYKEQEFDL